MLNITNNRISENDITHNNFSTIVEVENKNSSGVLVRLLYGAFIILIIILFLPWTQNIRSYGYVSTLTPWQKPQAVTSIIGGRIEQWYVKEGDFVQKGDTILKLSEIKDNYFDKKLLNRTRKQLELKEQTIEVYGEKINTQENQFEVLKRQRDLQLEQYQIKLQQTRLKNEADSNALIASEIDYQIAQRQFNRTDSLYQKGLKSLTALELKKTKLQKAKAMLVSYKNKWLNSKNELINIKLNIANVEMKYNANVNKLLSTKYSTENDKLNSETQLSKLQTQLSNYEYRTENYYLTAPQAGYITKIKVGGVGETIKQGKEVLLLMPEQHELIVETYVYPIDLPLIKKHEKVSIQFDGWPSIVFSGWPNVSTGTFSGEIYAIDQFISPNGKYRILVKPDTGSHPWPTAIRYGSGTSSIIMLNDVPVWYELWRKINGFPPKYYTVKNTSKNEK